MKKLVIAVCFVSFFSMVSLGQAAEIVRTPFSLEAQAMFLKHEENVGKIVDPEKIIAGESDAFVGVLAVLGLIAMIGAIAKANKR